MALVDTTLPHVKEIEEALRILANTNPLTLVAALGVLGALVMRVQSGVR